jgi:hypothetical protein
VFVVLFGTGCQPVTKQNIVTSLFSRPTLSCKLYTMGFPVRYGSPRDVFAASSSFVPLHTLRIEEKKETAAVVANAIVQRQGSLQRFKFVKRLEFSAGQWPV